MAKFIEKNTMTGVETWADSTIQDHRQQFHYRQDVEPILEVATAERNSGYADRVGKQTDIHLYARVPPVTILEIKHKYGVDCFNRNHLKRFFQILNEHYPHLKCTDKIHNLKN